MTFHQCAFSHGGWGHSFRIRQVVQSQLEAHRGALRVLQLCRVHQTLRVTPAMEAGLTNHVWSLEELIGLLEPNSVRDAA
jgi:hypothetical protein